MAHATSATSGPDDRGGCPSGAAVGQGATALNSFDWNICKTGPGAREVTGTFQAAGTPPSNILIAPKGPNTCADIQGDTVAFYYPFAAGSTPPPNPALTGLLIVAVDGGQTGHDKIGFAPVVGGQVDCSVSGPMATAAKATALPLTSGEITVTDKS
jgi:hypothetical protein